MNILKGHFGSLKTEMVLGDLKIGSDFRKKSSISTLKIDNNCHLYKCHIKPKNLDEIIFSDHKLIFFIVKIDFEK